MQRRSHDILKEALPEKFEYILCVRLTRVQEQLYCTVSILPIKFGCVPHQCPTLFTDAATTTTIAGHQEPRHQRREPLQVLHHRKPRSCVGPHLDCDSARSSPTNLLPPGQIWNHPDLLYKKVEALVGESTGPPPDSMRESLERALSQSSDAAASSGGPSSTPSASGSLFSTYGTAKPPPPPAAAATAATATVAASASSVTTGDSDAECAWAVPFFHGWKESWS